MLGVIFKGLIAHRRRMASTLLAVLLGIAFLSGTMILGDTIKRSFNNLLATANSGVDAYVRQVDVTNSGVPSDASHNHRGRFDEALLGRVRSVRGVAAAEAVVQTRGVQLIDKAGKPVGGEGRGAFARGSSWRTDSALNPFKLAAGHAPTASDEVVVDKATAEKAGFRVGDTVTVLVPDPRPFRLAGTVTFGGQDSSGGGSYALFSLATTQSLMAAPGKVDAIVARSRGGVSQTELVSRIRAVLPPDVEVLTGAAIVKSSQDSFQQRISGFTAFLSSFAFIAVIVGAFVIHNTFSILTAQRSRESALLRAIGARRRQVLSSVLLEALVVGMTASAVGVAAGIGVGAALRSLFRAVGFPFPPGGLVLRPATVIIGLAVGVLVTVFAALMPAVRASRVAPLAALRESAIDTSNTSRARMVAGIVFTALGVAAIVQGVLSKSSTSIGVGAGMSLLGVVVIGPVVARPIARLIGGPAARLRGVSGNLARENAMRNPRRTAGTASALLVGVTVVSFFTVVAASLQATTEDQIAKSFVGDLAVAPTAASGFSPQLASQLSQLPQVAAAAPLRLSEAQVEGGGDRVLATDPVALSQVLAVNVASGSLSAMGPRDLAVSQAKAKQLHLKVGGTVSLRYPSAGVQPFTIAAVFDVNQAIDAGYVVSTAADGANSARAIDQQIFVKLRPGTNFAAGRAAVESVTRAYPNAQVQDEQQVKQSYTSRINSFLAVIFGMLALAILIALLGISNTLQLSVYERTRELGLLRAVGSTRKQLRAMVRWEAVIVAVLGTVGGLALGVVFAWAIVHGLGRDQNVLFRVPYLRAVIIVLAGATAGILAALRPAARAGRLDVIRAVATD